MSFDNSRIFFVFVFNVLLKQMLDFSYRLRQLEEIPGLFEICSVILRWLLLHEDHVVFINFLVSSACISRLRLERRIYALFRSLAIKIIRA